MNRNGNQMTQSKALPTFIVYIASHVMIHVFTQMHVALIPVFMEEFDISLLTAGALASIPLLVQTIMGIPSGLLADRLGRRVLLSISLIIVGTAGATVSLASDVLTLAVCLSALSLSSTLYHPSVLSAISELFHVSRRSRALGVHGAAGTAGIALGPLTLGLLMVTLGWRSIYLGWAIPALLLAVPILFTPQYEPPRAKSSEEGGPEEGRLLSASFLLLLAIISVRSLGLGGVSAYMTTFLVAEREMTAAEASFAYGLMPLAGIAGAVSGGFLADKMGNKRWLSAAYICSILLLLGMANVHLAALILIMVLYGYFNSSTMGAISSMVAEYTPTGRRGIAYALFFIPMNLAAAAAPLLAGYVAETLSIWHVFPVGSTILIVALALLFLLPAYGGRRERDSSALAR